ncbi:MAG: competence/damage-inducible protein A [Candidatus Rariloculaceae bacterium]
MTTNSASPTACILLIGNEILSGKTQDLNLQYLGSQLASIGVKLLEARVLQDDADVIVATVNECRAEFDYVFTTGGIGPTHDDITAQCIATAFGRELILDEEAVACLQRGSFELNEARLKMARVPEGSSLIANSLSNAPGFRVDNVFVLAGVPSIARAMFETLAPDLAAGDPISSRNVDIYLREGDIAGPLEGIASRYADVEIGSYPFRRDGRLGANLVVRGTDEELLNNVLAEIIDTMTKLGDDSVIGDST